MLKITNQNKESILRGAKVYVKKRIPIRVVQVNESFSVETREGWVWGDAGDWLAEGVEGKIYPIGKKIFQRTYEPINP